MTAVTNFAMAWAGSWKLGAACGPTAG
jgi:hypothetical protein